MKFVINGEEFTKAVKRIVGTVPKRPVYPLRVTFEAKDDSVLMTTILSQKRVSIRIPAYVVEAGSVCVDPDDLGMVCGLDKDVTYEDDGQKLIASNQKKRRSVNLRPMDSVMSWKDYAFSPFGAVDSSELMDAFKVTDSARLDDTTRIMLTGFCLTNKEIVALDGYHLVLRKINVQNAASDARIVLPAETYADLKNLVLKNSGSVSIEFCEKRVKLSCDDFTYEISLLEGDYVKYEQIIPKTFKLIVEADVKEMLEVVNEYKKYKGNKGNLMFVEVGGGIVTTSLCADVGYVADKLENCSVQGDDSDSMFVFGNNIRYMIDVLKAMDEDRVEIGFNTVVSPARLRTEKTIAMTLPVRISGDSSDYNLDGMMEFIKPMREALQIPA